MTDALTADAPALHTPAISYRSPLESRRFLPALAILFVGSGCAALIYEVVWLQLLQLVIGASAVSLGVLLGTFMGGMCLGSLLFPRLVSARWHPLAVYAILEAGIGLIGLSENWLVPHVSEMYVHMGLGAVGTPSVFLRGAFAGICLLPPTILMGATLPAIARWVETTPRGISWLGFFYGGNIVGAVIGCLTAGFYLLPNFNMVTATLVAVAINGGVSVLGFVLSRATRHEPPQPAPRMARGAGHSDHGAWAIYVAIGISGLTGLGAEVVWTRLLSLMLAATVYTFSNILAVFLLGLGIGSSVGAFVARSSRNPRAALAWCQFLLAAGVAWAAYAISYSLPFWPIDPTLTLEGHPWYQFQLDLARCFWAVFPGALLWGASFPLALAALARRGQDAGRLVGGVYAANTIGAIIGALAFSMELIPHVGTQGSQRLLVALCCISAIVAALPMLTERMASASADASGSSRPGGSPGLIIGGIVAILAIGFWLLLTVGAPNWGAVAWGRNSATNMCGLYPPVLDETTDEVTHLREAANRGLTSLKLVNGDLTYKETTPDNEQWIATYRPKLISALKKREALTGIGNIMAYGDANIPDRYCSFIGEGMNVSVAVTYDAQGYRYFHGAGKVQASSHPLDMRLQRTLGHISALMKPDPKEVLVVACGAGVTAGSFVPYGSNITIVDIEPMVPKYVTPQFWKENYDVIPEEVSGRKTGYKNTHVIIDDGRHFIKTTPKKFDIITSDPIDPWVKGCAALNTVEYYQMCRDHLNPGGVVALWIPLYESSEDTTKSVIATFFKVFPNGIIWSNDDNGSGYDAVLFAKVGENGSTTETTKVDIDAIQDYIDKHEAVKKSLQDVGFNSGHAGGEAVPDSCEAVELLATYAGTASRMTEWTKDTDNLINYDANLRLQYVAGLHVNEFKQKEIFAGILEHYSFPNEIFTGSPAHLAALKKFLEATGRMDRGETAPRSASGQ